MEDPFQSFEQIVLEQLEQFILVFEKNCKCFIFGSFLTSKKWNDIDILFVYKNQINSSLIKEYLEINFSETPFDLLFLSYEEEEKLNFVSKYKAKKLSIVIQENRLILNSL